MDKTKKIYAVCWDGEEQENYLSLTDDEYANIMHVLEVIDAYDAIVLRELKIKEF